MLNKTNFKLFFSGLMLLYCLQGTASERESFSQNFLFFPFAHVEYRPGIHGDQDLKSVEVEAGSDFLYLLNYRKIRVLTEIFFTNEEIEFERYQFGLNFSSNKTLWLGRFSTPLGYWNSNYHHGLYLQTSVHRPGIIESEDAGGILPNHITGALLDGQYFTESGALSYSLAAGLAPKLDEHLETYSIGDSIQNKLHGLIKLAYQPDETNPSEYGMVVGVSTIDIEDSNIHESFQSIFAAYSHQSWDNYRLTTAAFLVRNRLHYTDSSTLSKSFVSAYLHGEYDIAANWIVYARAERSLGASDDPYLALFEDYETERNLGGIRFDITRRQAISMEISKRVGGHDDHTHVSMQWSAAFP